MDGPIINQEQAEAVDEIAEERRMNSVRYSLTTDNIMSSSEHNRAGVKLLEAKAKFYRRLAWASGLLALSGSAAILIEVVR